MCSVMYDTVIFCNDLVAALKEIGNLADMAISGKFPVPREAIVQLSAQNTLDVRIPSRCLLLRNDFPALLPKAMHVLMPSSEGTHPSK